MVFASVSRPLVLCRVKIRFGAAQHVEELARVELRADVREARAPRRSRSLRSNTR